MELFNRRPKQMTDAEALSDIDLDAISGGIIVVGGITSRGLTISSSPAWFSAFSAISKSFFKG
ncbi:hypothetical protein [Methylobacterium nodulans]|uniref:Uncharacterized protein n=1 Tax=Methylobacterium nodulans (strain LMG 21967 / CNCM I-2342 / ORS 2060) TaxID=460265 RepID=B8II83_METNO|nr:hypothetical protein [Methylobacterium nodulans]ACL57952.1 hypothetical protein Mnod_3009 [Methylobacterium nodulans ORS 2060]